MRFAFLLIKSLFPSPLKSSTILPLYCYNTANNLHMSCVSVGNSPFSHYATNYDYYNNESLVSEDICPVAIGRELIDGQINNINFHPTHASDSCEGFFEWEGEIKSTKRSCWGCGAVDVYHYKVEPIVEGTNCGAPLNTVSMSECNFSSQNFHFIQPTRPHPFCLLTLFLDFNLPSLSKVLNLIMTSRDNKWAMVLVWYDT